MVGTSGRIGKPLLLGSGKDADAAGGRLRQDRRRRAEADRDVAGDQVLNGGAAAAIGNVADVDAGLLLEQLAGDVMAGADAGAAVAELAGVALA